MWRLVIRHLAGVWVVAAKQCAVGVADLGLGRARSNSQGGVQVGTFGCHVERVAGWWAWSRPCGRDQVVRMASVRPARVVAPFGRGRRAACVRRSGVERAGKAGSHLVKTDSQCGITCPPIVGRCCNGPGVSAAVPIRRCRAVVAGRPDRGQGRRRGGLSPFRRARRGRRGQAWRLAAWAMPRR
jgi:hypothetical protein